MRSPSLRARAGFTLPETILSMTLMLILIGLSTQLFRNQGRAVSTQSGVLDAQSNSRFALSMLDRELRVAGVGVADAQPMIVAAGPSSVTFNADLVSLDTSDLQAVYINPDADSASADVMKKSDRTTVFGTTFMYPDTTYTLTGAGANPSLAETISYWLSHDSTSSRGDEYILFRRVNAGTPKVVARGLQYSGVNDSVFQYFIPNAHGVLTAVSPAALPLVHSAVIHGAGNDTANSHLTDSVRQVKVRFRTFYHNARATPGSADSIKLRETDATIHLMNAGLIKHAMCGNAPISVTNVIATAVPASGSVPQTYVNITWTASSDEATGERDIQRYALYRRLSTATTFDAPFSSVAPGSPTYSFADSDVSSAQSWVYGVAAQDCTPATSSIATSNVVVIP